MRPVRRAGDYVYRGAKLVLNYFHFQFSEAVRRDE